MPPCASAKQRKQALNGARYKSCGVADLDEDQSRDNVDNCPGAYNPEQKNCDYKAEKHDRHRPRGDACDDDFDDDGVPNAEDNCPYQPNSHQFDADQDTIGNECDCCPFKNPLGPGKRTGPTGCAGSQVPNPSRGLD